MIDNLMGAIHLLLQLLFGISSEIFTLAFLCKVKVVELRSFYFSGASVSGRSTVF
jgi:hypothetical protein